MAMAVSNILKVMSQDVEVLWQTIIESGEAIVRLEYVKTKMKKMDITHFRDEVMLIMNKWNNPGLVDEVEKEFKILEEKIEERERTDKII